MRRHLFPLRWLAAFGFFSSPLALAVGEVPYSFSMEGVLYEMPAGTTTLLDNNAQVRVQITDSTGNCVLYDEAQPVDTHLSDGVFNIQVGSAVGSLKRMGSDPGNSMGVVFQNRTAIPATGGSCAGSLYNPSPGATRFARLIITPSATGVADTLAPMMEIGAVPTAQVANTLDGIGRGGFLQVNSGAFLTQSNLESIFTGGNFSTLTSLLAGGATTSTTGLAINAGTGGTGGIDFNINGSTKAGIAHNGDFSVDGTSLFVQASSDRIGIGTSAPAATLDLSAKTDAIILPKGTDGQRPTTAQAGMIRFNTTSSKVEFHDGSGWVTIGSDISGITAGGDLSGTYPSPSVAGLLGRSLDTTAPTAGQVLRYVSSKWTPASLTLADLVNNSNGSAMGAAGCTANQTMYYNATNKALECQAIALSAPVALSTPEISGRESFMTFRMGGDANTVAGIANLTSTTGAFGPMFYGYRPGNFDRMITSVRGFTDAAGDVTGDENALVDISGVVTNSNSDPINGTQVNPTNRNILSVGSWNGPLAVFGPTGNLGLGTVRPSSKLEVIGNGYVSGSVGIGSSSPGVKLDVNGGAVTGAGPVVRINTTGGDWGNGPFGLVIGDDTQDSNKYRGMRMGITSAGHGYINSFIGGGNKNLLLNYSGGNVGIGTDTPSSQLDVNGNAVVRGVITANSIAAGNLSSMYSVSGDASTANYWVRIAEIDFVSQYQWWTGSFFLNSRLGVNAKIDLTLRQTAGMGGAPDVVLNTDSISTLFDATDVQVVVTSIVVGPPALTRMGLYVRLRSAYDSLTYQPVAAGVVGYQSANYSPGTLASAVPAGTATASTGGQSWTQVGTLAQTYQGFVGIGTINPGYNLHVVGTAGLSSGTSWANASDARLKNVFSDYEHGLEDVLKLHTVRFRYKPGNALNLPSETPMTGFVAQEVREVIPEAVRERADGYLELNVDPIHWAVVNAVKELYAKWVSRDQEIAASAAAMSERVKALEAENRHLKARFEEAADRLERLEAKINSN